MFTNFQDEDRLAQECEFARQLGFVGKMAIHPRQVEIINRILFSTAAEIETAQKLADAFEAHVATGKGVFAVNGRMVNMPIVRAAQRILG
ncbi:MAG: HpcH/HpaI aldolase/citrate lyase family protein [Chloroflexi bacterium]|nr:HpcH/HpaI aldolase/citrate lyase family protein [Chloroflexota bacterium]